MQAAFGAFFTAFFASVILTPAAVRLSYAVGAVDLPGGRKTHLRPTARLGGVALFSAAFLSAFWFAPFDASAAVWLCGGALIAALGVTDDCVGLSPGCKLAVGLVLSLLPIAFGLAPTHLLIGNTVLALPIRISFPLTALWTLTLANAFNMIDGTDGLAATQTALSAAALAVSRTAPAALCLCGAALGFLPYNRPQPCARIFMGDCGALFFGFSLAVLSLGKSGTVSVFLPLFFAVPLFDLLRTALCRLLRRQNPFAPARDHIHHLLLAQGLSKTATVLLLTLLSSLFILLFIVI